ncbi:transposase, partial [Vibrio vulnificus]
MTKPRYKTTNWKHYNQALINRGSLTFWIDEEAIQLWKQIKQGNRGRPRLFSDLAITTALMVKRVFSMCIFRSIPISHFGIIRSPI